MNIKWNCKGNANRPHFANETTGSSSAAEQLFGDER